jgi:hypothetical protein
MSEIIGSTNYPAAVLVTAALPLCLGLLCFFGAVTSARTGRRDRSFVLAAGGTALIVVGLGIWSLA